MRYNSASESQLFCRLAVELVFGTNATPHKKGSVKKSRRDNVKKIILYAVGVAVSRQFQRGQGVSPCKIGRSSVGVLPYLDTAENSALDKSAKVSYDDTERSVSYGSDKEVQGYTSKPVV